MRFTHLNLETILTHRSIAFRHFFSGFGCFLRPATDFQSFTISHPRYPTKPRRRPSGVILVLVLLMLTLCACIASQVASRTIRLTGQAAESQRELQSRWAIVSMRRSILNEASLLLKDTTSDPTSTRSLAVREDSVVLGGNRYQLILKDESAKAPIARMLKGKNQQEVKPILRQLLRGRAILRSNIQTKPTQWSEIIDLSSSESSSGSFASLLAATQRMTLWSDGRLNIMTADLETLDAVWRYRFNAPAPDYLTSLRQTGASANLQDSNLKAYGLSEQQREFAATWLTATSTCYSLWMTHSAINFNSQTMIYVRSSQLGYAEESFGFHHP